jgi:ABC-type multidrug transport system ATPase subunit
VREHLQIYAGFKGVPSDKVQQVVDTMIAEIELTDVQE